MFGSCTSPVAIGCTAFKEACEQNRFGIGALWALLEQLCRPYLPFRNGSPTYITCLRNLLTSVWHLCFLIAVVISKSHK